MNDALKNAVANVDGLTIVVRDGEWTGWFAIHDETITEYLPNGRRDWPVTMVANCASLADAKKTARRLAKELR